MSTMVATSQPRTLLSLIFLGIAATLPGGVDGFRRVRNEQINEPIASAAEAKKDNEPVASAVDANEDMDQGGLQPRAEPKAKDWIGRGYDVGRSDVWNMRQTGGKAVFLGSMPEWCYRDTGCPVFTRHEFSEEMSYFKWSLTLAGEFGLGATTLSIPTEYGLIKLSANASLGGSLNSSVTTETKVMRARYFTQRKCYALVRDDLCAYNESNIQPSLLSVAGQLPKGEPTVAVMQRWQNEFVERFGSFFVAQSTHGATINSLSRVDNRSLMDSRCLNFKLCGAVNWNNIVPSICNELKNTTCTNLTLNWSRVATKSTVIGGDVNYHSRVTRKDVSAQDLDAFMSGGNYESASTAYNFKFESMSKLLRQMHIRHLDSPRQYGLAATRVDQAMEFATCNLERDSDGLQVQVWDNPGCRCVRECSNGGTLDKDSCTCACRTHPGEDGYGHGWTGPTCKQEYGVCQPGHGTVLGRWRIAQECGTKAGLCYGDSHKETCKRTEVCCAGGPLAGSKCCPLGSRCSCIPWGSIIGTQCECRPQ